jgi:RES domain
VWLRVAHPSWNDPLDPSYAREHGGRWNRRGAYATLYLNGDVATVRLQIERMLAGTPVVFDDLDDEAYTLVAARLPRAQICADAVTVGGLRSLGLPRNYPVNARGGEIKYERCQADGARLRASGVRGVWCKSACTPDGRGRELAWFPASAHSKARPVWAKPRPLGAWRFARVWSDLGFEEQPDPLV